MNTYLIIIITCGLIILSYFYSLIGKKFNIPSVILLVATGAGLRLLAQYYNSVYTVPLPVMEMLGVVGLIMIVLEACLDLSIRREKLRIIRSAFFSSLVILVISSALITLILRFVLDPPLISCIVYSLPLAIVSSAIVLPSVHHLSEEKKEFLIYEASFSDIIGIIVFNYFISDDILTARSLLIFGGNILSSVLLAIIVTLLLLILLTKSRLEIKFFMTFAIMILLYSAGKLIHLPALIIIMVFGLLINNWEYVKQQRVLAIFPHFEVSNARTALRTMTAETAFMVRTFFFIIFGYSIDLSVLFDGEVLLIGTAIVFALLGVRWLYLKFFARTNVFPEVFFMPRGLVTVLLFYSIPARLNIGHFNEGILFFVVIVTSLMIMVPLFSKKIDINVTHGQI